MSLGKYVISKNMQQNGKVVFLISQTLITMAQHKCLQLCLTEFAMKKPVGLDDIVLTDGPT
jgi:hypothetical protein